MPRPRPPSVRRRKPAPPKPITISMFPERGLKIGEAARALGVETYVLRFWETQFPFLKPKHTRTKHRFYQEKDLDVLRLIKRLLHDEGFTIVGANKHIKEFGIEALMSGKPLPKSAPASSPERASSPSAAIDGQARRVLNEVRRDLESIHKILED
ncbi:MAG TPA: MerR family transcriptional regulator [Candidatus Binatus sp.]|uniref:MerR family transcriptional regulator n=1 Tax=Candidatus Binatus sp. TaxID=2811406 RepID=UPI002F42AFA8